jgi:type I restriction enzyme S subunit
VKTAFEKQFPDASRYRAWLVALWDKYASLGLANAHFVSELASGKKNVVFQRLWEMMIARHLDALGFKLTTSDEGPDFRIVDAGKTIWIEAICPEAMGIPPDWLEGPKPGEVKVGSVPNTEILLRWTAAVQEKRKKLDGYIKKGIVKKGDAYVIAVNGGQLGAFRSEHGISRFPYALEAVYPVGPIGIPINPASGEFGHPFVSTRVKIENANGSPVPTTVFLDKANADVSAVIAFSGDRSEQAILPLIVIHNHFASVPIPKGIFGAKIEEWETEEDGEDGVLVRKIVHEVE